MRREGVSRLILSLPEDSGTAEMLALYEEWPELSPGLELLRLEGKEPLMSEEIWEIFDFFGDLGGSGKIRIEVESGLNVPPDVFDRFLMKTHYVNDLNLVIRGRPEGLETGEWIAKLRHLILHGHMRSLTVISNGHEGSAGRVAELAALEVLASESRPGFLRIRTDSAAAAVESCIERGH